MHYPEHMMLEVTAKCNFRCPYCYCVWHERPELAGPELDTKAWSGIIDKCSADGCDDILLTGGEALLRKDIFMLLKYARAKLPKAKLTLFTNASRLDESIIKKSKLLKVHLATSLQGLKTYAAMTGTKRKPFRLLALMARAAELKWPMAVSLTITQENKGEAADMFAAAALSGAATIQIGAMMAEGRGRENTHLMLSREEWECVKESIRNLPNANVPYTFADEFICRCREQPSEWLQKWGDDSAHECPAGKTFGVVGPNGAYRICLHAFAPQPVEEKPNSVVSE